MSRESRTEQATTTPTQNTPNTPNVSGTGKEKEKEKSNSPPKTLNGEKRGSEPHVPSPAPNTAVPLSPPSKITPDNYNLGNNKDDLRRDGTSTMGKEKAEKTAIPDSKFERREPIEKHTTITVTKDTTKTRKPMDDLLKGLVEPEFLPSDADDDTLRCVKSIKKI